MKVYKLKYFISMMKIARPKSWIAKISRIWIHKFYRTKCCFFAYPEIAKKYIPQKLQQIARINKMLFIEVININKINNTKRLKFKIANLRWFLFFFINLIFFYFNTKFKLIK